jgi:polyphosphate kinase
VLKEAKDETVPLLEALFYLAFDSQAMITRDVNICRCLSSYRASVDLREPRKPDLTIWFESVAPDGLTTAETLSAISKRAHELAEEQHLCFINTILPQLTSEGIYLVPPQEINNQQARFLEDFFQRTLYPILTPLAIDPGHPFPYLANRSLCFVVSLHTTVASRLPHADLSILHIPAYVVPRFISLPAREGQHAFVLLEDVLRRYVPQLYLGFESSPAMQSG